MTPALNRVWLLSNDSPFLDWLQKALETLGCEVLIATDGAAALQTMESNVPDFVLIDTALPSESVVDVCRAIRSRAWSPSVYILLVTQHRNGTALVEGMKAGADDFLVQPFDHETLAARMQTGRRILELQRQLVQWTHCDSLTGVLTRRSFLEAAAQELTRAQRESLPLSCVVLDLDFFKPMNDTHGHAAGDDVLRAAATVLKQSCRPSDIVSRLGGDEFCVLLTNTREDDAYLWAERVRCSLAAAQLTRGSETIRFTGSLGVVERTAELNSADALIDRADQAMFVAKRTGRDRVVAYRAWVAAVGEQNTAAKSHVDPFHGAVAADCMVSPVTLLNERDSLAQAVQVICGQQISALPVVNDAGQLCGIVSEQELLNLVPLTHAQSRPVGEVMKRSVVTFRADSSLRQVYDLFCRDSTNHVVVVDPQGCPLGIIGRRDLLNWYFDRFPPSKSVDVR